MASSRGIDESRRTNRRECIGKNCGTDPRIALGNGASGHQAIRAVSQKKVYRQFIIFFQKENGNKNYKNLRAIYF